DGARRDEAEVLLDVGAEGFQDFGGELLGLFGELRGGELDGLAGAHEALELAAGVLGVGLEEAPGAGAGGDAAAGVDADDPGREGGPLGAADQGDLLAVEHGGGGVGGAEVDADVEGALCHRGSGKDTRTGRTCSRVRGGGLNPRRSWAQSHRAATAPR